MFLSDGEQSNVWVPGILAAMLPISVKEILVVMETDFTLVTTELPDGT